MNFLLGRPIFKGENVSFRECRSFQWPIIHSWLENGPGLEMYFLEKMVIFLFSGSSGSWKSTPTYTLQRYLSTPKPPYQNWNCQLCQFASYHFFRQNETPYTRLPKPKRRRLKAWYRPCQCCTFGGKVF